MPIEIRELHIKAVIDSGGGKGSGEKPEGAAGKTKASASTPGGDMQEMVDLCVEKLLEILKEKTER